MNVLFLSTGNSARSILGEVLFNDFFSDHGHAVSAGSNPTGIPNPYGLEILKTHGHDTAHLKSQHVDEFIDHTIDLIISVCVNAENDCVIWTGKGRPKRLHWPLPDPETLDDFAETYSVLKR